MCYLSEVEMLSRPASMSYPCGDLWVFDEMAEWESTHSNGHHLVGHRLSPELQHRQRNVSLK